MLGWRGDQLVAVWPFVTFADKLRRHARQLVASGVELHELLVDPSADTGEWVREAWRALTSQARVDVVDLSFFEDGADAQILGSLGVRAVEATTSVCVHVELRREADWDAYYNSLSKSYRKDFAKSRRRLEALGALAMTVLSPGDARIESLVDWTLAQKRRWAERTGKRGEWIYSDRYRDFLVHQLANPDASCRNLLLTLTIDGNLLATQIGALGKDTFEAVISGFDADYEKHSPGARLNEAMIRWAWEAGVDCALGAGAEPYKLFWSRNRTRVIRNHRMAVSRWGVAALASRRLLRLLRLLRASRLAAVASRVRK